MTDENLNGEGAPSPEEGGNRAFLIAAGILGAIALLAVACIAIYALFILPQRRTQQTQQMATLSVQNTEVARAITQTSAAVEATFTPTVTLLPTATATLTPTSVVAIPTNTVAPTIDPRTATVAALLTQAAGGGGAVVTTAPGTPTATALPNTGFADDVGLPAMLGIAVLLVGIIFVARRLRTA